MSEFSGYGWIGRDGTWYCVPDRGDHINIADLIPPDQNPMVHIGGEYALFSNDCDNLYLSKEQVQTLFDWCTWAGLDFDKVTDPITYLLPREIQLNR